MPIFHLRATSGYAPMQGALRAADLRSWVEQHGATVGCFTDPGTMHGAYVLQKNMASIGARAIHGVSIDGDIFLASLPEGIQQLFELVSHHEAQTPEPESLSGITVVTGGPGSTIRRGESVEFPDYYDTAHRVLVELQIGDEAAWPDLADLAGSVGADLVATADVRYGTAEQRLDYMLVTAVREKRKLADVEVGGSHLLSPAVMQKRFKDYPWAIETLEELSSWDWPQLETIEGLWPSFPTDRKSVV